MSMQEVAHKTSHRHALTLLLTLCLLLVLLCGLSWSLTTLAADIGARLTATPDKCISLRKGQNCYQKIRVKWSASKAGDYCLLHSNSQQPIDCWQNSADGATRFELIAKANTLVRLIDMSSNESVAQGEIKVAWVYRERRRSKRSWRLF